LIFFNTTFNGKHTPVPEYSTLGRRAILIGRLIPHQVRRVLVRDAGAHRRCDCCSLGKLMMAIRDGAESNESIFVTVWFTNFCSLRKNKKLFSRDRPFKVFPVRRSCA
jgi:hypothetical protein